MGVLAVNSTSIVDGTTSRLIRASWVAQNGVQTVAFDLRDRTPPELYVSFSMTFGASDIEHVGCAIQDLSKKLKSRPRGFLALLDIALCLQDINDEKEDIIAFRDKTLPHCGLFYLSDDLVKIQEAKTTLAYLASERLHKITKLVSLPQK